MSKDKTNPKHYQIGEIESITFILDWDFNFLEGNIIKYICRYKFKHENGLECLKKARWYLDKLISQLEE